MLLAGCGGGGGPPAQGPGARLAPVQLADCADWRKGGVREREATIDEIEAFAGGPSGSPAGHGTTLPDDKAYDLFDSYCRNRFARGFKLYKLYTRAASFRAR